MRRIIVALVALLGSFIVAPGPNALAATGCGNSIFPPAYGNPGFAYASCGYLAPGGEGPHGGEKVRVVITCSDSWWQLESVQRRGGWVWLANTSSEVSCGTRYPYVYYYGYEIGTGP